MPEPQAESERLQPQQLVTTPAIDFAKILLEIDFEEVKILEKIYLPEPKPYVLSQLHKELRLMLIRKSKEAIRRKVRHLAALGALEIVENTNPLAIWPVKEHGATLRKIIAERNLRYSLHRV